MNFDYHAQPKETVGACNLCNARDFFVDLYPEGDRYGLEIQMGRCKSCGLEFLNPRMTRDAYRDFYADGTYRKLLSEFYGQPVTAESIEPEQQNYAEKVAGILAPFFKARRTETLLDIGGSTGVVASRMAKQFDLEAAVLEPSEAEAKRAMDRGLIVMIGTIEDMEPNCLLYDAVLLCQTVDHLTDIAGALRTIRASLVGGGLLFVDIVEKGPVKVDHPYYLTQHTMADYLRRTGFRVLMCAPDEDGLHYNFVAARA